MAVSVAASGVARTVTVVSDEDSAVMATGGALTVTGGILVATDVATATAGDILETATDEATTATILLTATVLTTTRGATGSTMATFLLASVISREPG